DVVTRVLGGGDRQPGTGRVADWFLKLLAGSGARDLKRTWTVEGMQDLPADRLSGILNPGSGIAMIDQLTGPPVAMYSSRNWLLFSPRTRIGLQVVRDPANNGYVLRERVDNTNVTPYSFRLNSRTGATGLKAGADKSGTLSLAAALAKLTKLTFNFKVKT